jgi:hypothetical protein
VIEHDDGGGDAAQAFEGDQFMCRGCAHGSWEVGMG